MLRIAKTENLNDQLEKVSEIILGYFFSVASIFLWVKVKVVEAFSEIVQFT